MKPLNIEAIHESFTKQAGGFESQFLNFSKEDYLIHTLTQVAPGRQDTLLEVAVGTCICGRAFAPHVHNVVCLDATLPMLQVGRKEALRAHLDNMIFVRGYAQELPFLDDSFDIVFSRLAFHHFPETDAAFLEMVRVLKPGGKLVMIDMEAPAEPLRRVRDHIETLRDPSHVKNLSHEEMLALFANHGLKVRQCTTTSIRQNLKDWLALTQTPENVQAQITARMEGELKGQAPSGFGPYLVDGNICFDQQWTLIIGETA